MGFEFVTGLYWGKMDEFGDSEIFSRIFFSVFPLSDIMELRHQSSAMCIIMLGVDTHPWSATKVGNPIPATILKRNRAGTFRHQPWATKISAHFGDNVAQMSRRLNGQICSHNHSALKAGAKRITATCHMAMPQCCYLAKGAKRTSHTTKLLTSSNISTN